MDSGGAKAPEQLAVKYSIYLTFALVASWLLWSGHFGNFFLLAIGAGSILFCLYLTLRMQIVDEEGAPAHLGLSPFTSYAPWLAKEMAESNIEMTKIILSPRMPMQRNMVNIRASQKTELGRVILANSITLTPGTVSVYLKESEILVHAVSRSEAEEDMSGEMDRRVCRLERGK